jgi:hypothetical protein
MSVLVGNSADYSTWGKLRVAYGLDIARAGTVINQYNSTYANGLKSAASGSGLIRYGQRVPGGRSTIFNQPVIYSADVPNPPGGYQLFFNGGTGPNTEDAYTVEFKNELLGETITGAGGSVTITNDLFTISGQADTTPDLGAITSIGKLTVF